MQFQPWPEIPLFHNVKKYVSQFPEILKGNTKIVYKAKIKLHGTNAGILLDFENNTVTAQSRIQLISEKNDNYGFAKWLKQNEENWLNILYKYKNIFIDSSGMVIWGEWVGPGVMGGTAISNIPEKSFVIFSAQLINSNEESPTLIVLPNLLSELRVHTTGNCNNTYVLPWYEDIGYIVLDFSNEEKLQTELDRINSSIENIEKCDPWVKSLFGIEGIGEGLVFYPITFADSKEDFENFIFKAKGEKHKVIKTNKPAQSSPEKVASVEDFSNLVLTEARLMQGMEAVMEGEEQFYFADKKLLSFSKAKISPFLKWIEKDVQKECQDELEISNLTWEDVVKNIGDKSRKWLFAKMGW